MIRIYLDWNIFSALKTEEFIEIKNFINKYKSQFQFPFSPAHFTDLMKSHDSKYFLDDLKTLNSITDKHFLRWEENTVKPYFTTANEYYKLEKNKISISEITDLEKLFENLDFPIENLGIENIGSFIKSYYYDLPLGFEITNKNKDLINNMFPNLTSNSTMWDYMKDIGSFSQKLLEDGKYYKSFRNKMAEKGFVLEANAGNWDYNDVINNIDEFLKDVGTKMTFIEYVKTAFKHREKPINQYELYTNAYLILDMIGYKKDRLQKPNDNMQNIQADGEHSFYGAHCDFFITKDKNLRIKSKVLYNKFGIKTKIIEPKEFISELEKIIDTKENYRKDFVKEIISFCCAENLVKHYPEIDNNGFENSVFKLPKYYFNYFNYLVYTKYLNQDGIVLSFEKRSENLSTFTFFTETEMLLNTITNYFGFTPNKDFQKKKKNFIYEQKNTIFDWRFEKSLIRLEKKEDNQHPILHYIFATEEKSD